MPQRSTHLCGIPKQSKLARKEMYQDRHKEEREYGYCGKNVEITSHPEPGSRRPTGRRSKVVLDLNAMISILIEEAGNGRKPMEEIKEITLSKPSEDGAPSESFLHMTV